MRFRSLSERVFWRFGNGFVRPPVFVPLTIVEVLHKARVLKKRLMTSPYDTTMICKQKLKNYFTLRKICFIDTSFGKMTKFIMHSWVVP